MKKEDNRQKNGHHRFNLTHPKPSLWSKVGLKRQSLALNANEAKQPSTTLRSMMRPHLALNASKHDDDDESPRHSGQHLLKCERSNSTDMEGLNCQLNVRKTHTAEEKCLSLALKQHDGESEHESC